MNCDQQKWPLASTVEKALKAQKKYMEQDESYEVRLQVYHDGQWIIRVGDASFDLDHSGNWGAGYLDRQTDCAELAAELIEECMEHYAQSA